MEIKDEGVCRFCLKTFAGRSMGRHLAACKVKKQKDAEETANTQRTTPIYHVKITSHHPYWLHIEMPATAQLIELDNFLRRIWLECCGHLSEFKINDVAYLVPEAMDGWWDPDANTMDVELQAVLGVKDKFEYQYDFGSTTYLEGQIYAARQGTLEDGIRILARNSPPEYLCSHCEAEATDVCMECWGLYCKTCLADHACGSEMALPVVNSPRTGVCGFTGKLDFDTFNPKQAGAASQ